MLVPVIIVTVVYVAVL